jgi:hypothetical protein
VPEGTSLNNGFNAIATGKPEELLTIIDITALLIKVACF